MSVLARAGVRLPWLWPLLAALGVYAIAPQGEWVWDDQILIRQQLVAFENFGDVLSPPAGIPQWTYAYYRPTVTASYLVDARLFGTDNPAGPHAANVLYHLLTTLFVWLLLRRLAGGASAPTPHTTLAVLIGATVFAVHPIHTESVSWITGRSDLLATLLLVPALWLTLAWRDRGSFAALLGSSALFLGALGAKEVAIAGLTILPLLLSLSPAPDTASRRPADRWLARAGLALTWGAAAAYYLNLRAAAGSSSGIWPEASLQALVLPLQAAAWYLQKLVLPWPQTHFVSAEMLPTLGLTAVILGGALVLVAWLALRKPLGWPLALLGCGWIGLSLAPSLAVTVANVSETPVAERYLYLPSVGLSLLLAVAWLRVVRTRFARAAAVAAALLVVVLGALTVQRGLVWLTDLRLWSSAVERAPGYGLPWLELGKARMAAGDASGATQAFLRARAAKNSPKTLAIANYNLGAMYAQAGDRAAAEVAFRQALDADQGYPGAHYGLGRVLLERVTSGGVPDPGDLPPLAEAAKSLGTALALNPTYLNAYAELARVRMAEGDVWRTAGDGARSRAAYQDALGQLDTLARLDAGIAARSDLVALRRRLLSFL